MLYYETVKEGKAMYLIVGLGNPEPEYSRTRHNMGFDVINEISKENDIEVDRDGFKSLYGTGMIENQKVILCKPQTYMNLSGDAIIEIMNFYKIAIKNVIIIYDDIDTKIGSIKIRKKGSSGGHNGIKSIIARLNTEEFSRIRIGTGNPENKEDLIEYVLRKLSIEEYEELQKGIKKGAKAICELLKNGIDSAMNKFN